MSWYALRAGSTVVGSWAPIGALSSARLALVGDGRAVTLYVDADDTVVRACWPDIELRASAEPAGEMASVSWAATDVVDTRDVVDHLEAALADEPGCVLFGLQPASARDQRRVWARIVQLETARERWYVQLCFSTPQTRRPTPHELATARGLRDRLDGSPLRVTVRSTSGTALRAVLASAGLHESRRAKPFLLAGAELSRLVRPPLRRPARYFPDPACLPLAVGIRGEPVGVTVDDLMTHAYVLGPSGTGKTALLARLVLALAERRVAGLVLDPHGDLVGQVLARLPASALPAVTLIDLTEPTTLPTLNPLWLPVDPATGRPAPADVGVRAEAVTAAFADIWGLRPAHQPNLLHFLKAALHALIATGEGRLADLPLFVSDPGFRARVLRRAGGRSPWSDIATWTRSEQNATMRAILNKAGVFTSDEVLRRVFSDPGPGLRLADCMDSGRLLLVNLPRGLVGEQTSPLIGSLLVTMLYQAALAREARPAEQRPPVVAVIDEFQDFALSSFAKVVTATRKYGVGIVVANQNLSRVADVNRDVLSTLLANVSTLVAFRLGADDAHTISRSFSEVTAADLSAQGRFECYWRLAGPDGPQVVSARTLPPDPPVRPAGDVVARLRPPPVSLPPEDPWA